MSALQIYIFLKFAPLCCKTGYGINRLALAKRRDHVSRFSPHVNIFLLLIGAVKEITEKSAYRHVIVRGYRLFDDNQISRGVP